MHSWIKQQEQVLLHIRIRDQNYSIVLHMKCAYVHKNTKLRTRIQFLSCKMTMEETAINFLIRLERKTNEARNFDIKISAKKFLWVLLNNMKHHKYNKERIASFLTTFELNPSSISQRWIKNKFYSLDEERMHYFRNSSRFHRESAMFSQTNKTIHNSSTLKYTNNTNNGKTTRCKYYYRPGHIDTNCKQKSMKRPPSMPEWVSKAQCNKCTKTTIIRKLQMPLNLLDQPHIMSHIKGDDTKF